MTPANTVESGILGPAGITQYETRTGSREVECANWPAHSWAAKPHPATGRLVCMLCHPIPERAES